MTPHIRCQNILLPPTSTRAVEQGLLIFADDMLLAVITGSQNSVDSSRGGRWVLEVGFGPCAVASGLDVMFQTPEEAQQWVLERVSYKRENEGPQFA
jgi:hypothetical protein